jgi:hypothetical protein
MDTVANTHAAVVDCSSYGVGTRSEGGGLGSKARCSNLTDSSPAGAREAARVVEHPDTDNRQACVQHRIIHGYDAHGTDNHVKHTGNAAAVDDQGTSSSSLDHVEGDHDRKDEDGTGCQRHQSLTYLTMTVAWKGCLMPACWKKSGGVSESRIESRFL